MRVVADWVTACRRRSSTAVIRRSRVRRSATRSTASPPEGGRAAAHRCRAAGQGQAVGRGGCPVQTASLPGGAAVDTRDDPGLESGRGRRDRPGPRDLLRRSLAGSKGIPLRQRRRLVAGAVRIVHTRFVGNCGTDEDTKGQQGQAGRGDGDYRSGDWVRSLAAARVPLAKRTSGVARIGVCDLNWLTGYYGAAKGVSSRRLSCANAKLASPHLIAPVISGLIRYAAHRPSFRGHTVRRTGPEREADQHFRWSEPMWWARQGLNL
jgi:hypothetical protein